MNTKELIYFRKIYECKSINKASQELFITPQGLSKIILNLENEVGSDLFLRSKKGVISTPVGDYIYNRSEALIEMLNEIQFGIKQIIRKNTLIKIGISCGVMNALPVGVVQNFAKENSNLDIYIEELLNKDVQEKIKTAELDVAFIVGKTDYDGVIHLPILNRNISLIVYEGHPFYTRESVSFQELKNQPLITLNEQFYCYKVLYEWCIKYGFQPEIISKTMESRMILKMCRRKLGIGIDVDFVAIDYDIKDIRIIPLKENPQWEIYMIYKEECSDFPFIKKFEKYIKKELQG